MKKIIVTGHGKYASGIQSTLLLLAGDQSNINYVDFTEEMSEEVLTVVFESFLEQNKADDILFFCDLMGGTPYKTAVRTCYDYDNCRVVAGCNVASLLEMMFADETLTIDEFANKIVETSIKGTLKYEKRTVKNALENADDGI